MTKDIANKLRAAIVESGYSANEIAKRTGVDQTTVSRFLRGHDMTIHRAAKIAEFLGLDIIKRK